MEPLEHSVPNVAPVLGSSSFIRMVVSNPLEHSGLHQTDDVGPGLVPQEPLEHSVLVAPREESDVSVTDVTDVAVLDPVEHSGVEIVVGAVGSAAPRFLTGWANDMEVDFMIDTGCQVTILATTVFERMCTADPIVRSKLRPCRRKLFSADLSPLTVNEELELTVVFPGLSCDMLFVVACIGSDRLLGTEALQSWLPHQLDLRTG